MNKTYRSSIDSPTAKRQRTDVDKTFDPDIRCIALLQSRPGEQCSRKAIDMASGCCGVHLRHHDRKLFSPTQKEDCCICLGAMKYKTRIPAFVREIIPDDEPIQGRGLFKTSCNHVFHSKCIRRWMVTHKNLTCPMCRQPILADLQHFTSIPFHVKLFLIYNHFPPPQPAYMFPSHLHSLLNMPSVAQAINLTDDKRAILMDVSFNCLFANIFFRVVRLNPGLFEE